MAKKDPTDTPAMRQFKRFKQQHPDCVLFFRMGDFYEMFFDDAVLANKVMGVTLTQRTEGVPMAGVPFHSVEGYLRRMIQAGHRVAVCDQVEDPKQAKGVVKRDVTRVITPGTLTDENLLDEGDENPLAAVMFNGDETVAAAWAELSTGTFHIAKFNEDDLADELARVSPSELLYVETADGEPPKRIADLGQSLACAITKRPGWQFRLDEAIDTLTRQFEVKTLGGFGLTDGDPTLGPASAIIHYLLETQKVTEGQGGAFSGGGGASGGGGTSGGGRIAHLQPPRWYERADHLVIDQTTLRSLEVEQTMRAGTTEGSLLAELQDCRTAMGKRMLRQWLCYPLCDKTEIETRQRTVGALVEDSQFLGDLRDTLDEVHDVQRIVGRIAVGRATPRDIVALGKSTAQIEKLVNLLEHRPAVKAYHEQLAEVAGLLQKLAEEIDKACIDSPPAHLRQGGLIKDGFDKELDEYRSLQRDSHTWLAEYQKQLIEQTGITSLKVGFNKVFGYYIEVSAANADKAAMEWTRKQTLKNAERYTTPPLKEFEGKVLSAESRAVAREQHLFDKLCQRAQQRLAYLHRFGDIAGQLDVLACFARRAVRHHYVKPEILDTPTLEIKGGRHPVLDTLLGDQFVPNDVNLAESDECGTLALITGPNMAGKSTYIRQTALIVLLAHTGSFVPADAANVGLCDRIFTRIGASDELHTGQSTFMVEMTETANICHHATEKSLVILDEIGRGTSTLDGLSLAWAIAEHLAQQKSRTLFATHYHEITTLAEHYENVTNLNVTVREWQDEIVFLHRIVPGATDRSYGIHVAKIAGLPAQVVERANELLQQLAVSHEGDVALTMAESEEKMSATTPSSTDGQMSLFTEYVEHPVVGDLRKINITQLTPLAAFDLLRKLQQQLLNEGE